MKQITSLIFLKATCNSKGKKKNTSIDNIGGEKLSSTNEEKLLGLQINSDSTWNVHVERVAIELKKRIRLLRRIRNRIPKANLS